MHVIVVAGIPGSGKTCYREHTDELRDMPVLDMETLRQAAKKKNPKLTSFQTYKQAMYDLLDQLEEYAKQGVEVVVEGIFWPGSQSLLWLTDAAQQFGWYVDYRLQEVEVGVAVRRVLEDYERDHNRERFLGRLFLIHKYMTEE